MNERLTEAELDWIADQWGHVDDIPRLVAEVREHCAVVEAARFLLNDPVPQKWDVGESSWVRVHEHALDKLRSALEEDDQ